MKKALKITIGIVLGLILLVGAGAAILTMVFDPNDYKNEISALVEKSTGFKAEFNGPLSLKILPRLAVGAEDVLIHGYGQAGATPLAALKEARLNMALLPLLSKKVEVDSIELRNAKAYLYTGKNGRSNWQAASRPPAAPAPGSSSAPQGSSPQAQPAGAQAEAQPEADSASSTPSRGEGQGARSMQMEIGAVILENCLLDYVDEAQNEAFSLAVNKLELREIAFGKNMGMLLDAAYTDKNAKINADVALKGEALYDPAKGLARLNLPDFKLGLLTPALARKESISGKLSLNADLQKMVNDVELNLASNIVTLAFKADSKGAGKLAVADGQFSLKGNPTEILALLGQRPEPADPKALRDFSLQFPFKLAGNTLSVPALEGQLDSTPIKGELEVKMGGAAGMPKGLDYLAQAKLNLGELDLDRYLPKAGQAKAVAPGKQPSPADKKPGGPLLKDSPLEKTIANLELTSPGLTVKKVPLREISLKARADKGVIELGALNFRAWEGRAGASGQANLLQNPPPVTARLDLNGLDLDKLLKALEATDKFTGLADFKADLNFRGLDWPAISSSLGGNGSFAVRKGQLRNFQLIPQDASAALLQYRQDDYPFENISGSFNIAKGVISNNDLKITSPKLSATGSGTINLAASSMDYRPVVTLGASPLPLRIHGPFASLSYGLDQEAVGKSAVQGLIQGLQQRQEAKKSGDAATGATDAEDAKSKAKDDKARQIEEGVKGLLQNLPRKK
ncbi:AsmA family protein [Desulfovibrio sp. OttesenSCG-928-C14]|nr:AsmA family protein [Desulfovibrio sp. OttesenSCG-928-C14]